MEVFTVQCQYTILIKSKLTHRVIKMFHPPFLSPLPRRAASNAISKSLINAGARKSISCSIDSEVGGTGICADGGKGWTM